MGWEDIPCIGRGIFYFFLQYGVHGRGDSLRGSLDQDKDLSITEKGR